MSLYHIPSYDTLLIDLLFSNKQVVPTTIPVWVPSVTRTHRWYKARDGICI